MLRIKTSSALVAFLIITSAYAQTTSAKKNAEYDTQPKHLVIKDSFRSSSASVKLSAKEQFVSLKLITLRNQMIAYYDSIHSFLSSFTVFLQIKGQHLHDVSHQHIKANAEGRHSALRPSAGISYIWVIKQVIC